MKRLPIKSLATALAWLLSLFFLGMWLLGTRYTSEFGIDHEYEAHGQYVNGYYRLRWPGDGSLWIGSSGYGRPKANRPVEWFDIGGRFLSRPRRPVPQSDWNRRGFWREVEQLPEGKENPALPIQRIWRNWIGIPGWLPVVLWGLLPLFWLRRRTVPSPKKREVRNR